MKDYMAIYLDKKFPLKIEIETKIHSRLPSLIMELYKSGEKRLFVRFWGDGHWVYHYFELRPSDLQAWFSISYGSAEEKLLEWLNNRVEKQKV